MAINKVDYNGTTLIDLTSTTATADTILSGYGAYGNDGVWIDGTATSGGSYTVATSSTTNSSSSNTSLSFSVDGEPTAFVLINTETISLESGYYYVLSIVWDGTTYRGTYGYYKSRGGRYIYYSTSYYSSSYSSGTLTISSSGSSTSNGGSFYDTTYMLIYFY